MKLKHKKQYQEHYDLIDKHIDKYFKGAEIHVFHEIPTFDIHLDIYHIKPKDSDFELLFTAGMSSIAMNVSEIPGDSDFYRFAELIVLIPKGGDFGEIFPSKTPYDWIISMIKQSAKFPHLYNTWLSIGHTIQSDEEMNTYSDNTDFCGCLVLPTMSFPEDFKTIHTPNGVINIYSLFPMYKEELEYKIEKGFNEFIQFLIKNNTAEIIDFQRANFCKQ
ncbi:suppressor of fused domain protein [Flammeovirga sp. MY04]|uniref:suppressor of fused domain protein n=1 Tax=Flammeovirga sp. MY04 TaxID=1191459 RepID=UPI0008061BBA|nr:suppressor of fused domain protein [Flammeovirga sp. MY04]ANQ48591.1 suppressor of fused domain protein [Flammeovirga sp. MY04]